MGWRVSFFESDFFDLFQRPTPMTVLRRSIKIQAHSPGMFGIAPLRILLRRPKTLPLSWLYRLRIINPFHLVPLIKAAMRQHIIVIVSRRLPLLRRN